MLEIVFLHCPNFYWDLEALPQKRTRLPTINFFHTQPDSEEGSTSTFCSKNINCFLSWRGDLSSSPLKFFLCVQCLANGVRFRPIQWYEVQGWIITHLQPPNKGWMKLINKVILNLWMIFQNELDFIHWLLSKIMVDPWHSSSIVDFIHQNHPYSMHDHPWNTIYGWIYELSF